MFSFINYPQNYKQRWSRVQNKDGNTKDRGSNHIDVSILLLLFFSFSKIHYKSLKYSNSCHRYIQTSLYLKNFIYILCQVRDSNQGPVPTCLEELSINLPPSQHKELSRIFFSIQKCNCGIPPIQGKRRSTVWTVHRIIRSLFYLPVVKK